jgi:hypothetical protein
MTQLIFNITGQIIKRGDNLPVVSDSVGYITAKFNFSSDWDGEVKHAIFKQGTVVADVVLVGDECDIPAEVMTTNRDMSVSVWGGDRITANVSNVSVIKSGYVEADPPTPTDPTQTYVKTNSDSTGVQLIRFNLIDYTTPTVEFYDGANWQVMFLAEEQARELAETGRVDAEGLRVIAEAARELAEQARQDAYLLAEAARDDAYDAQELVRDGLYATAEDDRDNLYVIAENARDAKLGSYDRVFADRKLSEKFPLKTFAQSVSGYNYLDYPNNTNGQISCVVEGNTLTQLIINGNFQSTSGFSGEGGTLAVANSIASVTGNGTSVSTNILHTTTLACSNGLKVYFRAFVRVDNSISTNIRLAIYGSTGGAVVAATINTPLANNWYLISGTATLDGTFTGFVRVRYLGTYANSSDANLKVMQVREFMGFNLTASGLTALTTAQLDALTPNYIDGTKHAFSDGGVLECKDKLNVVKTRLFLSAQTLRSVPATKDTVSVADDRVEKTQRVSAEYTLQNSDYDSLELGFSNVDVVVMKSRAGGFLPLASPFTAEGIGRILVYSSSGVLYSEIAASQANNVASIGKIYTTDTGRLQFIVAKGTYANLAAAQAALAGTTLTYQLATPIVTDITNDCQGTLQSYPSGSIQTLPAKNGYTTTSSTDVTGATSVYKVKRFDYDNGKVVEVDVTSACSIVGNNLVIGSFQAGKTYHYSCLTDTSTSTVPNLVADVGQNFGTANRNFGGLTTAWTLTDNENKASSLVTTNAGGAVNIIAEGVQGKEFIVRNQSGHNNILKTASSTGATVANNTVRRAIYLGTDFVFIT